MMVTTTTCSMFKRGLQRRLSEKSGPENTNYGDAYRVPFITVKCDAVYINGNNSCDCLDVIMTCETTTSTR
eukprot:229300-Amphidinium_carterae.2